MAFDVLVLGGEVLDGSGAPAYRADVGIIGDRIAKLGKLAGKQARTTIKAEGRTVCPGFIDIHSHDDYNLPANPLARGKTAQGVTTVVTGNCGFSPAPVVGDKRHLLREAASFLDTGLDYSWQSFSEFLHRLPPRAVNVAPLVGHVTLRCCVMGMEDRPPQAVEMERMTSLLVEAMEAGAFGMSTGLIYPPSCFAEPEEITALARVAARHGGVYFTHMRDEGPGVMDSVREAIAVGRGSGARVQISHLKIANKANWGSAGQVLGLIDEAREQGMALACDQYPYTAASTGMKILLPQWVHSGADQGVGASLAGAETRKKARGEILQLVAQGASRIGEWKDVLVADSPSQPDYVGLNLNQIAERETKEPVDALLDLLVADHGKTLGIFFTIGEEDMFEIMRHPAVAVGSDGIFLGVPGQPDRTKPHPRYFGTFPRVIGRYCREAAVLGLPEAVRKMTSLPADILGLTARGRIEPGFAADLVVFDPATVIDTATYQEPHRMPIGIETVLVNGIAVVEKSRGTENTPGLLLRRQT